MARRIAMNVFRFVRRRRTYLRDDSAIPRNMSAEERLEEVASLVVHCVLRFRGRHDSDILRAIGASFRC